MPSKTDLRLINAKNPLDLKQVRIPGLSKPFEQLTVSELVQLRPGSEVADTWEINAVTDNISATTSAALQALGQIHKERVVNQVVNQSRLNQIRTQLGPQAAFGRLSSEEAAPDQVRIGDDDVFKASDSIDPFKA